MSDLKSQLIKLGSTNPELRPHIRAVLASSSPSSDLGGYITREIKNQTHQIVREARKAWLDHFSLSLVNQLNRLVQDPRSPEPSPRFELDSMTYDISRYRNRIEFSVGLKPSSRDYSAWEVLVYKGAQGPSNLLFSLPVRSDALSLSKKVADRIFSELEGY